jgi:hypothetical protein
MEEEITSERLAAKEAAHEETAEHAVLPAEQHKERRRAEKTAYLREKVAEQEAADP